MSLCLRGRKKERERERKEREKRERTLLVFTPSGRRKEREKMYVISLVAAARFMPLSP